MTLRSPPAKCWDHSHEPPHRTSNNHFFLFFSSFSFFKNNFHVASNLLCTLKINLEWTLDSPVPSLPKGLDYICVPLPPVRVPVMEPRHLAYCANTLWTELYFQPRIFVLFCFLFVFCFFKIRLHCVSLAILEGSSIAQAGFKFSDPPASASQCWNGRCVLLNPHTTPFLINCSVFCTHTSLITHRRHPGKWVWSMYLLSGLLS